MLAKCFGLRIAREAPSKVGDPASIIEKSLMTAFGSLFSPLDPTRGQPAPPALCKRHLLYVSIWSTRGQS